MGEEAEVLYDRGIDDYIRNEERKKDIHDITVMLEKMSDKELLDYLCKQGRKLNTLDNFKTYDVAKQIKDNNWIPTRKQREALINTAAIALNT